MTVPGLGSKGQLLDEETALSLVELCRLCGVPRELVVALIDEGILDPLGTEPGHWRFTTQSIRRVRLADSLKRDLGVNIAGVAVVIDLVEELEMTRANLRAFNNGP